MKKLILSFLLLFSALFFAFGQKNTTNQKGESRPGEEEYIMYSYHLLNHEYSDALDWAFKAIFKNKSYAITIGKECAVLAKTERERRRNKDAIEIAKLGAEMGNKEAARELFLLAFTFIDSRSDETFDKYQFLYLVDYAARMGDEDAKYYVKLGGPYLSLADAYLFKDDLVRTRYYAKKGMELCKGYEKPKRLATHLGKYANYAREKGKYKDAFESASLGAELGNYIAIAELGMCYYKGLGVTKNIQKAKLLLEAAKRMEGYDSKEYNSFPTDEYDETLVKIRYINDKDYQALNSKRIKAENEFKHNASTNQPSASSSSSSQIGAILTIGAIIAGIAAICDAVNTPKPSSSLSSSSRSSSSSSSGSSSSSSSSSYSNSYDYWFNYVEEVSDSQLDWKESDQSSDQSVTIWTDFKHNIKFPIYTDLNKYDDYIKHGGKRYYLKANNRSKDGAYKAEKRVALFAKVCSNHDYFERYLKYVLNKYNMTLE